MLKIVKDEPSFFTDAKKKVKLPLISSAWKEIGKDNFKTELREHILLEEQNMLCVYCEQEIESDGNHSNTDHFKIRDLFPRDTLAYDNLLVSCKNRSHCENKKDNFGLNCTDYNKIINPVIENPNNFFDYGISGDILVKDGLSNTDKEKAKFTIEVFELNHISLQEARKNIVQILQIYKNQEYKVDEIFRFLTSFQSFIEVIYTKLKKEE